MEASTTEECRLSKEGLPESLCSLRNKLYCKAKLEINDKLKEKASGEPSTGNLYPRFDEGRCPLRAPATLLVQFLAPRICFRSSKVRKVPLLLSTCDSNLVRVKTSNYYCCY